MSKLDHLQNMFTAEIGAVDLLLRVPGRANIIGEHIDYCGGRVLPFAISQSMHFVAKRRDDNIVTIKALDMGEQVSFEIGDINKIEGWASYFAQALNIISSQYSLSGLDIYFLSDIPMGAGVSSSSAICVGIITIIDTLYELSLSDDQKVDIASQSEHGIGIRGGIMDQYTILFGKENHALLIDCAEGKHENIDLSDISYKWILLNTNVKHNLAHSPYNDRRSQVEEALKLVNEKSGLQKTFKEINLSDISFISDHPMLKKRLLHIYNEMCRVDQAVNCIRSKSFNELGQLLYESHLSLSQDYEVSCVELDFVCDQLSDDKNVLGARMMGGGFGGSVIALVKEEYESSGVVDDYKSEFNIELNIISIEPRGGLEILTMER